MIQISTYESDLISYRLWKVLPEVFAVEIPDSYDRGMLFCCYQEFYESPYKEIRGQQFSMIDFMKFYKDKRNDVSFNYTTDWFGYNIPSDVLLSALNSVETYGYKWVMLRIYGECYTNCDTDFYVIGVDSISSDTYNHELAHGLYYTNKQYRKEMNALVKDMSEKEYSKVKTMLLKMGYRNSKDIINDEIQAYMVDDKEEKFLQIFNKYKNHGTKTIGRSNLEKDNQD